MLRGWSRNTANKSKTADGRHLVNSKNRDISATAGLLLTKFSMEMHLGPLDVASC